MSDRDDLATRLSAFGFDAGSIERALAALAGSRVPTPRRLRAWRQVIAAEALLADGRAVAEIVAALRQRFGISRASAYRRLALVSVRAPIETTRSDDSASSTPSERVR